MDPDIIAEHFRDMALWSFLDDRVLCSSVALFSIGAKEIVRRVREAIDEDTVQKLLLLLSTRCPSHPAITAKVRHEATSSVTVPC